MLKTIIHQFYPDAIIEQVAINSDYSFTINKLVITTQKVQLLFTLGLSDKARDVKVGFEKYKKTEIFFILPDYWNLSEKNWPIHWLNKIGEIPEKNNTWLGPNDTIPAGKPPKRIDEKLPANYFMLTNPIELKETFEEVYRETGISFLSVIPIYQTEFDYKTRNSGTVLMNKIIKSGSTDKLDLFRKNVCRKRFLGF